MSKPSHWKGLRENLRVPGSLHARAQAQVAAAACSGWRRDPASARPILIQRAIEITVHAETHQHADHRRHRDGKQQAEEAEEIAESEECKHQPERMQPDALAYQL